MHQTVGQLFSGSLVDLRHCGPGNVHLSGALLMSQLLQIHKTDNLVFI